MSIQTPETAPPSLETLPQPVAHAAVFMDATSGSGSSEKGAKLLVDIGLENGIKAFVLAGTPNGTVPDFFNPIVSGSVERGAPVFVLSTNYAYDEGPFVKEVPYESQAALAQAGGVVLKDININGLNTLLTAIDEGVAHGLVGHELSDDVIRRFGVPEPLVHFLPKTGPETPPVA